MNRETYKEKAIKQIVSLLARSSSDQPMSLDFKSGREFLATLASWAGKGKDEIVQLICREIGTATAAVLKEPLAQVLENRKLQLTLELVPKTTEKPKKSSPQASKKSARKKKKS
ncbi:MAG: hypothetical protein ACOH5I_16865 [Oligoflexus sp.]